MLSRLYALPARLLAPLCLPLCLTLCLLAAPAGAQDLLMAQAANFMPAMEEILPAFEAATGIKGHAVYSSTGKLYAQISNGAPFDVFLAADEARPAKLAAEGKSEAPFVYARGKVVLWLPQPGVTAADWQQCLQRDTIQRIAVANPESAPYGAAAVAALNKAGLFETVSPRLAYAQSIAQVFQFASSGAADAGFCALSSTLTEQGRTGTTFAVPQAPSVIQAACILKSAPNPQAAARFVEFLNSPLVAEIKAKYGYE
ncbi:molybdate ABC transporter substrate-binding protein [Oleidesulfovibrio alaskensis]|uniref:molybdate ABC transporter substrate-binding protein n=1 Tax=Oleidesulfovibrio alaskensis TaxID=58180 RepID=UPI000411C482|nr:molybdate ABC transporter substrate-binding protein [Oleidesulfovibrio alaskensis]